MLPHKLTAVGLHAPGGTFTLGVQTAGFKVVAALAGRSTFGSDTHRLNFPDIPCCNPEWPLVELADAAVDLVYSNPAPGQKHLDLCEQAVSTGLILRPKAFVLEGGADLFEPGSLGAGWSARWADYGYNTCWLRLSADQFGLPQLRRRSFFIAAETPLDFDQLKRSAAGAATVNEALSDLQAQPLAEDPHVVLNYASKAQHAFQKALRPPPGHPQFVSWHVPSPGAPSLLRVIPHLKPGQHAGKLSDAVLAETYWKDRTKTVVQGGQGRPSMYYRRLHPERPAPALPGDIRFIHPTLDRFITPREAARLMGIPDAFHFAGLSASRANLEIGRTVSPIVAEAVARHVAGCLISPQGRTHVSRVDLTAKPETCRALRSRSGRSGET